MISERMIAACRDALGETLVAYAVSGDGRTLSGPVLASADLRGLQIVVALQRPLPVSVGFVGEVTIRVYGSGGMVCESAPIEVHGGAGGTVSL